MTSGRLRDEVMEKSTAALPMTVRQFKTRPISLETRKKEEARKKDPSLSSNRLEKISANMQPKSRSGDSTQTSAPALNAHP
jgi:hypothetical protein